VALDGDGRAIDGSVESSSGYEALDRAALTAVRRATWSVRPGVVADRAATNAIVRVPIDFRLDAAGMGSAIGDR
jgi:TonB family protein